MTWIKCNDCDDTHLSLTINQCVPGRPTCLDLSLYDDHNPLCVLCNRLLLTNEVIVVMGDAYAQQSPSSMTHYDTFRLPKGLMLVSIRHISAFYSNASIAFFHARKLTLKIAVSWWRQQMETFSAVLLALCAGNSLVHRWIPLTKASDEEFS